MNYLQLISALVMLSRAIEKLAGALATTLEQKKLTRKVAIDEAFKKEKESGRPDNSIGQAE